MKTNLLKAIAIAIVVSFSLTVNAQTTNTDEINAITTAVPFLMIAPDSRSGAMGDIGVATSPDANSQHWNAAKFPFIEHDYGFSVSYSPWLRSLVNDISLAYLSGYYKLNNKSAISGSLRYFSMGEIQFTDIVGNDIGTYKPNEFAIDAAYSRLLGDNFSGAVTLRYINSNLTSGQNVGGQQTQVGQSVAADVAVYYRKKMKVNDTKMLMALGLNVSNIGNKISYSESLERDFIPTNFRIGGSLEIELDKFNSLTLALDINKLLVPTPPVYALDSAGNNIPDGDGFWEIEKGMDPRRSVGDAMFTSWYDAPDGFSEEIKEFYIGGGVEYAYDEKFFVRGGYFYENKYKGNRKYFTLGAGFAYNVFTLDFSYLIPTSQRNPMQNTLRFTLVFNFDAVADNN